MTDGHESDDRIFAERFRREYQRTPLPGPEGQARLVAALRGALRPQRGTFRLSAWLVPRTFAVRPALAVAAALALIGVGVLLGRLGAPVSDRIDRAALAARASPPLHAVRFVLVDPKASRVALVGDFNGWDVTATPMRRDAAGNAWIVTVPLVSGWHAYAFVVDEARWVHDPRAPLAPPDGFGGPRSVVVVEEPGT